MKKIVVIVCFAMAFLMMATFAQAGSEIDVLLETLVNKGIITPLEAQIIQDETKQKVSEDIADGKAYGLPAWVQNLKLKGDLRLRYQYERKNNDTDAYERGRLRYRLGLETKINNNLKVGAGIASGADYPRSTNQTFNDSFETGDLRLDYAYAEYVTNIWSTLKVIGGKFKRKPYLWATTDMMWDGDVNPAGGAISYVKSLTDNTDGFINSGVLVIDEQKNTDQSGPYIFYVQAGAKYKGKKTDAKVAGIFYSTGGVKGKEFDWTRCTNSGLTGSSSSCSGGLKYDYDSGGVSAEFGVKKLFGGLPLEADERIAVFGDYIVNPDPSEQNVGWAAGVKFGNKKVKNKGTWQAKYQYVSLGKDAVLDIIPDSDRYGGGTDVKSHEAAFQYALNKNVILGIDYYQSQRIKAAKNLQHLLQADVLFKF